MKVLLDEYVDWQFLREIAGHEVKTARQMGWSTVKNGAAKPPRSRSRSSKQGRLG